MKLITRLCSFLIRRSNSAQRPSRDDDGYALIVMLIAVTVITIALLAVLPSTFQEARREREEELIFRGNQYAQAIYLFQKHFNRYPNSVKELLHTDNLSFLRKPWPDPMTPSGKWRFIHASGTGALLDSWTQTSATGGSPLSPNGQNPQTGTNPANGPNSSFGSGSGSSGFGGANSLGGSSSFSSSSSSFNLGGGTTAAGTAGGSSSQSDFGWPASSGGSTQSTGTNSSSGSPDTGSWAAQDNGDVGLADTLGSNPALSATPGLKPPGAADSINSLSPAALHAEEPGRPLDQNGKPKMSPDCLGGSQKGGSSSSASSASSSNSSSFASSSFSSSSSFGSPGSQSASGFPGSSGFSSSSQSSSSFASAGSSGGPLGVAIAGVASCSDQASLRTYNKHHRYSEWEFLGVGYNTGAAGAGITPNLGTGQNGLGQQGQGSPSGFGSGSSSGFGPSGNPSQPGSPGSAGPPLGNTGTPPPPPPPDEPTGP